MCWVIVRELFTNFFQSGRCWNSHVVFFIQLDLPVSTTCLLWEGLDFGIQIPPQWKLCGIIQSHTGAWGGIVEPIWFRNESSPWCHKSDFAVRLQATLHESHSSAAITVSVDAFT